MPDERQPDDRAREIGDQFIASLNHDIRTPLSGILGMMDLLLETELSDEQREYTSTARLCADQLLEMLNSALEYTSLSHGGVQLEPAEFHLPHTLESLAQEFAPKAKAKGLSLLHESNGVPEYVVGDELRLRQALSPLIANAIKFTSHGEVELSASANGRSADGVSLQVSIRDTGTGIQPEKLDVIFESFRQLESGLSRSHAGMGLGLAVAKKLADTMGGDVSVESALGVGSTFQLSVPVGLPAAAETPDNGDSPPGDRLPRILFVDDNDVARRVVTHILRRANYSIECAEDGAAGIQAARREGYDLILMDLQMPGVNGLEATEAIRRLPRHAGTPIVALTANYSKEFARQCQDAGLDGFLSKPIQREELVREVARHLR